MEVGFLNRICLKERELLIGQGRGESESERGEGPCARRDGTHGFGLAGRAEAFQRQLAEVHCLRAFGVSARSRHAHVCRLKSSGRRKESAPFQLFSSLFVVPSLELFCRVPVLLVGRSAQLSQLVTVLLDRN